MLKALFTSKMKHIFLYVISILCMCGQVVCEKASPDDDTYIRDLCESLDDPFDARYLSGKLEDRIFGVWSEVIAYGLEVEWIPSFDSASDQLLRELQTASESDSTEILLKAGSSSIQLIRPTGTAANPSREAPPAPLPPLIRGTPHTRDPSYEALLPQGRTSATIWAPQCSRPRGRGLSSRGH